MAYTSFKSDKTDASGSLESYIPTGAILTMAGPYSLLSDADLLALGFLQCNGQDVSQTTYSALFSVIGSAYNGNPNTAGTVTTPSAGFFRVPNLHNTKIAIRGTSNTATVGTINAGSSSHTHLVSNTNNTVTWNIANNATSMVHNHASYTSNVTWNDAFNAHAHSVSNTTYNGIPNTDASSGTNGNTNNTGTPQHNHNLNFNAAAWNNGAYTHNDHTIPSTGLANNTQYNASSVTAFTNAHTHTATLAVTNTSNTELASQYAIPYSPMLYFIKI